MGLLKRRRPREFWVLPDTFGEVLFATEAAEAGAAPSARCSDCAERFATKKPAPPSGSANTATTKEMMMRLVSASTP